MSTHHLYLSTDKRESNDLLRQKIKFSEVKQRIEFLTAMTNEDSVKVEQLQLEVRNSI